MAVGMQSLERNQSVTTEAAVCNHCVTKDEVIAGLRNQIAEMESKSRAKPKRDRAAYMRTYRRTPGGVSDSTSGKEGTHG